MPKGVTELGKKVRGKSPTGRRLRAAAVGQEFLPGGGVGGRILKGLTGGAKKAVDGSYPDLYDGVRGMQFIEAVVQSHQSGNTWIEMK